MPSMAHRTRNSAKHIIEVFLKNITHTLPGFIFWKDTHSMYMGCNQNYAKLVGLRSCEEIIGKKDQDLNWQPSGHTAEIFQQGDWDTLNGHPILNQQETLVLPNGKKLITLVSKSPIYDDAGRPLGIVGYFTDITALKEKERELHQAKQQSDAANQAKSAFIMNISHDIRTPLSGLLGMAGILQNEVQSETGKEAMTGLIQSAESLFHFLNEVIEFSKHESGDLPIYELRFNLKELIDNIIRLVTPSAQEKNLDLNFTYDADIPAYLIGDSVRLQRIILNLVTNAIKFTSQGSIDVRVKLLQQKRQRAVIQCQIQDTGIGIPLDKQTQIFTRFERLHPSYQGHYAGYGLGLALVKQFIRDLEGEIEVESHVNRGSLFTFRLPLRIALCLKENAPYCSPLLPGSSLSSSNDGIYPKKEPPNSCPISCSPRILVVEDHLVVQRAVKNLLTSLGAIIDTADQGKQALEKIQTHHYDLVVMDIGLPDQNGCDVATAIHQWQRRHHQKLSSIVALSAHLNESEQKRCLDSGMKKTYSKPLDSTKAREMLSLIRVEEKENSDHSRLIKNKKNRNKNHDDFRNR